MAAVDTFRIASDVTRELELEEPIGHLTVVALLDMRTHEDACSNLRIRYGKDLGNLIVKMVTERI